MRRTRDSIGQSSDIAFLLIIFFLLLSGLSGTRSVGLSVEQSSHPSERTPLHLFMGEDGSVRWQDTTLPSEEVPSILREHGELHLSVDESCAWQHVVHILSLAEASGIPVSIRMAP